MRRLGCSVLSPIVLPRWARLCVSSDNSQGSAGTEEWNRGDLGYQWKQRHLTERRSTAQQYLFDPQKRQPIHNAVRQRAAQNTNRLTSQAPSPADGSASQVLLDSMGVGMAPSTESAEWLNSVKADLGDELVEWTFGDEFAADDLRHVPEADMKLLADEIYGRGLSPKAQEDEMRLLRNWFKLRSGSNEYQSYLTIPEGERTPWSPWYLRDLK